MSMVRIRKNQRLDSFEKFKIVNYIPYQLNMLSERASQQLAEFYKKMGVTVVQWRIMALIDLDHDLSSIQISQHTMLDKSRVARALDKLIDDGLVHRTVNQQDKRAYILELTEKGQSLYEKIARQAEYINFRLNSSLSNEEREAIEIAFIKFDGVLNELAAESKLNS